MALQEASPGAWTATCHNLRNMEIDTKVTLVVSGPYLAASQQWPIQRPLGLISALSPRPTLPAVGFKAVPDITGPTTARGSRAERGPSTCGFFPLKVSANGAGRIHRTVPSGLGSRIRGPSTPQRVSEDFSQHRHARVVL